MQELLPLIPLALAVVLSPLRIALVLAILATPGRQALVNAVSYTLWGLAGLFLVTLAAAAGLTALRLHPGGEDARGAAVAALVPHALDVLLLAVCLVLAVVTWLRRPREGQASRPSRTARLLDAVGSLSTLRAGLAGLFATVVSVKNLLLAAKAGSMIAADQLPPGAVVLVSLMFAVAASLGAIVPVALALGGTERVRDAFARGRDALVRHNALILALVFALLAVVMLVRILGWALP